MTLPWPYVPEPHEGEHCYDCGRGYALMVYSARDNVWDKLTPDGARLLCPPCLDARARAHGIFLFWRCEAG